MEKSTRSHAADEIRKAINSASIIAAYFYLINMIILIITITINIIVIIML
jgi:hypothetical protein